MIAERYDHIFVNKKHILIASFSLIVTLVSKKAPEAWHMFVTPFCKNLMMDINCKKTNFHRFLFRIFRGPKPLIFI